MMQAMRDTTKSEQSWSRLLTHPHVETHKVCSPVIYLAGMLLELKAHSFEWLGFLQKQFSWSVQFRGVRASIRVPCCIICLLWVDVQGDVVMKVCNNCRSDLEREYYYLCFYYLYTGGMAIRDRSSYKIKGDGTTSNLGETTNSIRRQMSEPQGGYKNA
ncbi:hypothetical protein GIB67_025231 [Kingdonia uniflora]|uniref:Uncharacterized protein n=1 Tax=Kingdonia uniflora TaxID=39325 RepID=A0A7J7L143_9MAGN|nr:hypothetical protein GIB67_025231 [Kingdonia uniflora]